MFQCQTRSPFSANRVLIPIFKPCWHQGQRSKDAGPVLDITSLGRESCFHSLFPCKFRDMMVTQGVNHCRIHLTFSIQNLKFFLDQKPTARGRRVVRWPLTRAPGYVTDLSGFLRWPGKPAEKGALISAGAWVHTRLDRGTVRQARVPGPLVPCLPQERNGEHHGHEPLVPEAGAGPVPQEASPQCGITRKIGEGSGGLLTVEPSDAGETSSSYVPRACSPSISPSLRGPGPSVALAGPSPEVPCSLLRPAGAQPRPPASPGASHLRATPRHPESCPVLAQALSPVR